MGVMQSPSLSAVLNETRALDGVACFDTARGETVVTWGSGPRHTTAKGWPEFVRATLTMTGSQDCQYAGGIVGWLGYEAGATVERMPMPKAERPTHDVCLWRTEGSLVWSSTRQEWTIHGSEAFRSSALDVLTRAKGAADPRPSRPDRFRRSANQPAEAQSIRYQAGVERVLEHVQSGDVYQVSLAWEHEPIAITDALTAWLRIRSTNPALRGCYLRSGSTEIISNSPELFLELDAKTRIVKSIPIKGTAPAVDGDAGRRRLERSQKERAELTMIVDLVRNDLGRIATPGSVIAHPREVRQCGDLWHAEQVVQATIAPACDAIDVVRSTFPPGSVTGAPKVRAMEVISDLEDGPRGVYTGAIGWFADDGGAHLNVAIRTATVTNGEARFHVGAGIVADSDPSSEWHETLAKAGALSAALAHG